MTKIGVALLGLVGGAAFALGSETTKVGINYGGKLAGTTKKAVKKGYNNLSNKLRSLRGKEKTEEAVIVEVIETQTCSKRNWMPSFIRNRMKQTSEHVS
jgi:hypothetical protein